MIIPLEPPNKRRKIENPPPSLPEHILIDLISNLTVRQILTLGEVNHEWKDISNKKEIWISLIKRDLKVKIPKETQCLKTFYKETWSFIEAAKHSNLYGHKISEAIQAWPPYKIQNNTLYMAKNQFNDKSLNLWDLDTDKSLGFFVGHNSEMNRIRVKNQCMCVSYRDNKIEIWDLATKERKHLFDNLGWTSVFKLNDTALFYGTVSHSIQMYDTKNSAYIHEFKGHEQLICDLKFKKNTLFSASDDRTIKMWDIDKGTLLHTFEGFCNNISKINVKQGCLFATSTKQTISMWNIKTFELIHEFKSFGVPAISTFTIQNDFLFAGFQNGMIKKWNIRTAQEILSFEGHKGGVNSLVVINDLMLSSANDHHLMFWNINKSKHLSKLTYLSQGIDHLKFNRGKLFAFSRGILCLEPLPNCPLDADSDTEE